MMKTILITLLCIMTSLCCVGQELTDEEVRRRIADFFDYAGSVEAKLRIGADGIGLVKKTELSSQLFSVYDFEHDEGFVIATNSADMPAVVAYADGGNVHKAMRGNPVFASLVKRMSEGGVKIRDQRMTKAGLPESVAPLLTDTWHQYEPFWRMTPRLGADTCLTGCVAHAMGEVMKFYRHPERGTGSYTYIDSIGCGMTLTADFYKHEYDWDNILDSYVEGEYTDEQADAVALLLSDCGISVNMQYSPAASGTRSVWQPIAMTKFFGYDRGIQMYFRDFFSWHEWENMLRTELAEGRPILMSGHSADQGHAFTCDGYDNMGLFHINWGWEGEADGFYNIQFLAPDLKKWYDKNNPERGLNLLQSVCVGVRPEGEPGPEETHSFAMSEIKALASSAPRGGSLTVATHDMGNVGWNIHEGDVALALKKGDEVVALLNKYDHAFLLEEVDDTVYNDTIEFVVPEEVETGLYRMLPVFQDNGDWKEVRTSMGVPNHLLLTVSADSVRLGIDQSGYADLKLLSFDFPDTLVWRESPVYSLELRNDGAEYCGRIYFALQNVDDSGKEYIFSNQGVTLGTGEVCRREFLRTPLQVGAGKYRLKVFYDVNLFNDTIVEFENVGDRIITVLKSRPNAIDGVWADKADEYVRIYDVSGRIVLTVRNEDAGADFDNLDMPAGIYVAVKNGCRIKFVKKRK